MKKKIGWITTWNSKCGIATYTKFLIENLPDTKYENIIFANKISYNEIINTKYEEFTHRIWTTYQCSPLNELFEEIIKSNIQRVLIQYQSFLFDIHILEELIVRLIRNNIHVDIILHNIVGLNPYNKEICVGDIKEILKKIDHIYVHRPQDIETLAQYRVRDNVVLFKHGVINRDIDEKLIEGRKKELSIDNRQVIATYGFLFPHKGIKEMINVFQRLIKVQNNLHLLLINSIYPHEVSENYYEECLKAIEEKNLGSKITFISDFLIDEESLSYLNCADLIVMPYQYTQESSSASVRYALSTKKTVLCTPLDIFNDVKDVVYFSKDISEEAILDSIINILNNENTLAENKHLDNWLDIHSWVEITKQLSKYWSES